MAWSLPSSVAVAVAVAVFVLCACEDTERGAPCGEVNFCLSADVCLAGKCVKRGETATRWTVTITPPGRSNAAQTLLTGLQAVRFEGRPVDVRVDTKALARGRIVVDDNTSIPPGDEVGVALSIPSPLPGLPPWNFSTNVTSGLGFERGRFALLVPTRLLDTEAAFNFVPKGPMRQHLAPWRETATLRSLAFSPPEKVAVFEGSLSDETGRPMTGMEVRLVSGQRSIGTAAVTGEDGSFVVRATTDLLIPGQPRRLDFVRRLSNRAVVSYQMTGADDGEERWIAREGRQFGRLIVPALSAETDVEFDFFAAEPASSGPGVEPFDATSDDLFEERLVPLEAGAQVEISSQTPPRTINQPGGNSETEGFPVTVTTVYHGQKRTSAGGLAAFRSFEGFVFDIRVTPSPQSTYTQACFVGQIPFNDPVPRVLRPTRLTAGRVLDRDGAPVPRSKIVLTGPTTACGLVPASPVVTSTTVSDADGNYLVAAPGPEASFQVWPPSDSRLLPSFGRLSTETSELSVSLEPGIAVDGRVLDPDGRAIAGATLTFWGPGGARVNEVSGAQPDELGVWRVTTSDANGRFSAALPP